MRNLYIFLSAVSSLTSSTAALRHSTHQLRDLFAFPKYEVDFLNDLPLSSSDASRAKSLGVENEEEWLRKSFQVERKRLGDGSEAVSTLEIVPMKIADETAQLHDYLCLMPSENATASQTRHAQVEEEHEEVDPAVGWAALSHLEGKCLYLKQGWFTYSYCHNSHIRQFREGRHAHPHPPGGYTPTEDTNYEAYTLGQTSSITTGNGNGNSNSGSGSGSHPGSRRKSGVAGAGAAAGANAAKPITAIDRLNHEHALSYGLQPSARYLVQRWSDGTRCDKTGRPREVEVQIHCSMTSNDIIYMIKEMAICQYVMIIHSPHLCSLPGFKVEHSEIKPAGIRCREVISDEDFERWSEAGSGTEGDGGRIGFELPPRRIDGPVFPFVEQEHGQEQEQEQESLKSQLERAMGAQPDEMMVLTWEEGEDGPVMVEGDGKNDKELLMKLLREFLDHKATEEKEEDKDKDSRSRHDEL